MSRRGSRLRFGVTQFCDTFGRTSTQRQGPRRRKATGSRAVPKKKARKASRSKVERGRLLFAIGQERLTPTGRVKPFTADQKRRLASGTLTVKGRPRGSVARRFKSKRKTGRAFREVGPEDLLALRLPDVPQGDPLTLDVFPKRVSRRAARKARKPPKRSKTASRTVAKKAQKVALALGSEIPGFEATLAILDALGIFSLLG